MLDCKAKLHSNGKSLSGDGMTQEHYQPKLEGFDEAYTIQAGDIMAQNEYLHIIKVVETAQAENSEKRREAERLRAIENARKRKLTGRKISHLLRPLGA
ncbi:hypothetical protein KW801_00135 [Candidatus Saccharibacteria bacterium]|nr:hypothetical protein [Candidatus Saccharibacteria bacterium]